MSCKCSECSHSYFIYWANDDKSFQYAEKKRFGFMCLVVKASRLIECYKTPKQERS